MLLYQGSTYEDADGVRSMPSIMGDEGLAMPSAGWDRILLEEGGEVVGVRGDKMRVINDEVLQDIISV